LECVKIKRQSRVQCIIVYKLTNTIQFNTNSNS